jgi:hypothetical protein
MSSAIRAVSQEYRATVRSGKKPLRPFVEAAFGNEDSGVRPVKRVKDRRMVFGRKAGIHESLGSLAANVRKRNQRGNHHVVPAKSKLCQMIERGCVARTAPLLNQQFSAIFDLSEGEPPFGANTAEHRAKACHRDPPKQQAESEALYPCRGFQSVDVGVGSSVIPPGRNWSTHHSRELLTTDAPGVQATNLCVGIARPEFGVASATYSF